MSTKHLRILPLLAVLLVAGFGVARAQAPAAPPQPAPPQPAPVPAASSPAAGQDLTVLVVDVKSLLQNSKAAKMVRNQIEQKQKQFAAEISHQEEALRKERDALQRQQSSMTPQALNQKGREFQQKYNQLDHTVQLKRQILEKANGEGFGKINQQMIRIIADIAKTRKANLVLERSELVLFDRKFDVTDEVLQKLDEQLPTMTVSFTNPTQPEPAAAAATPAQSATPSKPVAKRHKQ
jgi:outer membrane protein